MNIGKSRCNQALDLTGDERRVVLKNHNERSSKVMLFILKARDYMCALAVIIGIGIGASVGAANEEVVSNEEGVSNVDDTQAPTTKGPSRLSRLAQSVKAGARKVAQKTSEVAQKGKELPEEATKVALNTAARAAKKVVTTGGIKVAKTAGKAALSMVVPGAAPALLAAKMMPNSMKRKAAKAVTKAGKAVVSNAGEAAAHKAARAFKSMARTGKGGTAVETEEGVVSNPDTGGTAVETNKAGTKSKKAGSALTRAAKSVASRAGVTGPKSGSKAAGAVKS